MSEAKITMRLYLVTNCNVPFRWRHTGLWFSSCCVV